MCGASSARGPTHEEKVLALEKFDFVGGLGLVLPFSHCNSVCVMYRTVAKRLVYS